MISRGARLFSPFAILSVVVGGLLAQGDKPAVLQLRITDDKGTSLPARVHLSDAAGKPVRPESVPFWRDHFVCTGELDLPLAKGKYRYEVERGPEYKPVRGEMELSDSKTLTIPLVRFSDLATRGWHGGDLHVHRPVADVPLLMRAEDLHVAGVLTWWNKTNAWRGQKLPDPATVRLDGRRFYDVLGGEDERGGGALLYFRRQATVDLSACLREYPSSMAILAEAKKEPDTWVDVEKPFWWDVPAWLATGQVDSIGIAHNHMHRGGVYEGEAWGRPRDKGVYPGVTGNGKWTQEIYYQVLNSGLRVPPSAGSASGVLPNPVGYNRVWVHTGKALTPEDWWAGLKAGRSFVSNGPLLLARAGGEWPGHVFPRTEAGEIAVEAEVDGHEPIRAIEVVQDGVVVKTVRIGKTSWKGSAGNVRFDKSGWLIVRAITDVEHTFRFASTAPWYVEVGKEGRPISKRAAEGFHDWARERRVALAKLVKDEKQRNEILLDHDRGIAFWRERVEKANRP